MARATKPQSAHPEHRTGGAISRHQPHMLGPHRGVFSPLGQLRAEFDRLFDDFFHGWSGLTPAQNDWRWGLDMQERDDAFVVRAEAPGFEPGDFDLQVHDHQLTLRASRKAEKEEDTGHEWEERELYRSVSLPTEIDAEKVDAQYHNGVLTVTLPKTEQSQGRRIEVKS
jgi:HSP20 family protein